MFQETALNIVEANITRASGGSQEQSQGCSYVKSLCRR